MTNVNETVTSHRYRRTAGALPWRVGPHGDAEVLLVHRRRQQDWTIAKGRTDPGESLSQCAQREFAEETGMACRLDNEIATFEYRDSKDRPRLVRYWSAQITTGAFIANDEIDKAQWFDIPTGLSALGESRERSALASLASSLLAEKRVAAATAKPRAILLTRCAAAVHRYDWPGEDGSRPLTAEGVSAARALTLVHDLFQLDHAFTAPSLRCRATIAPVALRAGLLARSTNALADGQVSDAWAFLNQLRGRGAVVSTHEDVIVGVLQRLAAEDGTDIDERIGCRRGAVWVLTADSNRRFTTARYLPIASRAVEAASVASAARTA